MTNSYDDRLLENFLPSTAAAETIVSGRCQLRLAESKIIVVFIAPAFNLFQIFPINHLILT